MGAKLSKKKKGYCLGAGKDGESTDTTEVEQKETENQEGQKDAAEPKGEKPPLEQPHNNGVNEEPKDKSEAEITTGETTKEESNQDQKPEIESSAEQEKVTKDQPQGKKEHDEGKLAAPEKACEKAKEVKSASEDKSKTECEVKEAPAVVADKPTQESKPVKEKEGSDNTQSQSLETKQSAPAEVNQVLDPVEKVEAVQTGKAPTPVETKVHILEKDAGVPTQANEPEKLEKVPGNSGKMEPSAPESVPVSEPLVESVVPEPVVQTEVVEATLSTPVQIEVTEPEAVAVPEKVDSALPISDHTSELVHSAPPEPVAELMEPAPKEPQLAPEPEPSPVPAAEPVLSALPEIKVETAVPEQPTAFAEQSDKPEKDPEPVLSPASENISETKEEQESASAPLPPNTTEVPDETAEAHEPTESQESLGCGDQGVDVVTIEVPTTEAASIKPPSEVSEQHVAPVIQNGPSENSAEDDHIEAHAVSTELQVEDKGEQKEAVEENDGLDKQPTQEEAPMMKEICSTPVDVVVSSENGDPTVQETKETHDASPHCNSEEKTENHNTSAEELKNESEPPAPEILEKHGVGNGLPIKEEIKVHLENNCDTDLHNLNGQSESHEIQVCNE